MAEDQNPPIVIGDYPMVDQLRDQIVHQAEHLAQVTADFVNMVQAAPDDDRLLDEWSKHFGAAMLDVSTTVQMYRSVRDVQGSA